MTIPSPERHLPFVAFTNPYPIIGVGEVQLGKPSSLAEPIQQFTNQRQWILVFDNDIIEALIIHAKAEASIWLSIKEDKCSGGGLGKSNKAVGRVGLDVSLQGFQLYWA